MRILMFLAALLVLTGAAFAEPVDESQTIWNSGVDAAINGSDILNISLNVPSIAATHAEVTFTARGDFGDFDALNEWVDLSVEGYNFGRWLDENNGNDSISGPGGDVGQWYVTHTGTAIIPFNQLLPRIADGVLTFTFAYSPGVSDMAGNDKAGVRVTFSTTPSPEPATALLFGLGVTAMAWRRRKRAG